MWWTHKKFICFESVVSIATTTSKQILARLKQQQMLLVLALGKTTFITLSQILEQFLFFFFWVFAHKLRQRRSSQGEKLLKPTHANHSLTHTYTRPGKEDSTMPFNCTNQLLSAAWWICMGIGPEYLATFAFGLKNGLWLVFAFERNVNGTSAAQRPQTWALSWVNICGFRRGWITARQHALIQKGKWWFLPSVLLLVGSGFVG